MINLKNLFPEGSGVRIDWTHSNGKNGNVGHEPFEDIIPIFFHQGDYWTFRAIDENENAIPISLTLSEIHISFPIKIEYFENEGDYSLKITAISLSSIAENTSQGSTPPDEPETNQINIEIGPKSG